MVPITGTKKPLQETAPQKNEDGLLMPEKGGEFYRRADELYRVVIAQSRTLVLEYDYRTGKTCSDPLISDYIQGDFSKFTPTDLSSIAPFIYRPDLPELRSLLCSADLNCSLQKSQDIRFYTKNRSYEWFRVVISVTVNEKGAREKAIITLNNVNDEVIARKKLEFLAEQDSLTKIPNKDSFAARVRMLVDRNPDQRYVLIRTDIERFHILNQLFGTEEGDRVLRFMGVKLQELLDLDEDSAYCRLVYDVFALCVPYDPPKVDALLAAIQNCFRYYPLECEFRISFGLYIIDEPAVPVDTMLDRAAHAQRSIKGNYMRHKAYYDDKLRSQESEQRFVLNEMAKALSQGQFQVYYQPKVRMTNRALVGAEALVRWAHPQRGLLSPQLFIPIFEKNGFIMALDSFVWHSVCSDLRRWLDEGRKVPPVSVNVSRVDLYNPRLVDVIVSVADKFNLPRHLLELELTESSFISDTQRLSQVTEELRGAGFSILMDDFGSGYSSLNALNDIDVDVLKLDMAFLSKSVETLRGTSILRDTIHMAKNIGLAVLAEGVETEGHRQKLLSLGCNYAQGYLFSRPVTVAEYERLMSLCPTGE